LINLGGTNIHGPPIICESVKNIPFSGAEATLVLHSFSQGPTCSRSSGIGGPRRAIDPALSRRGALGDSRARHRIAREAKSQSAVDTTPTGSELLYATTAPRRIFHRKETAQRQCVSAGSFIGPEIWSSGSSTRSNRRVATRYDKLAANYLAFVQLASIRLRLRVNESTT
jgi:transposase